MSSAPGPVITAPDLDAHLAAPHPWRALPDGTPLTLTPCGMEFIIDDFGGFNAGELRSAHRLLYFATRTPDQLRALWVPPVPRGEHADDVEPLALHIRHLQAEITAWAGRTFGPDTHRQLRRLALELWAAVIDRVPVSAEKKNPAPAAAATPGSSNAGSPTPAGSSPAPPTHGSEPTSTPAS